jgi:hypothetical protein
MFPGVPKVRDLEPVIDSMSQDWIRYSSHCWIIQTEKHQEEIYDALERRLDSGDCFLISAIDLSECSGRLPGWVWNWVKTKGHHVMVGEELTAYRNALPSPSKT